MEEDQARYLDPTDWGAGPCWQVRHCAAEWKAQCPAWQYEAGYGCWEISGTYCQGRRLNSQGEKRKVCCQCEVFRSMLVAPKQK